MCSTEFVFLLCIHIIVDLCQNSCESIAVKLGMMPDTTKLYSMVPVWMILTFIQGHRVTGKVVNLQGATQMFMMIDM